MDSAFDLAYRATAKHEGGFVNDPKDPGGRTNMGVTEPTLRQAIAAGVVPEGTRVQDLTPAHVRDIFRELYWNAVRGDDLPPLVAATVFDAAVHHGPRRATVWLQLVSGADVDDKPGPATVRAVKKADKWELVALYNAVRLEFMAGLGIWPDFGRGFARRVAANLRGLP